MDPQDFKRWRKQLKLSQKDAANALGLKRRMIQYYEKGERDGEKVKIPLSVRLACFAIAEGVADYHGPSRKKQMRDQPAKPGGRRAAKAAAKANDAPDAIKDAASDAGSSSSGPGTPDDKGAGAGGNGA